KLFPRTAGRSSQLFNTGTVHWMYRILMDGLFGLRGDKRGLRIVPQMPSSWNHATVTRYFRGAEFQVDIKIESQDKKIKVRVNDVWLDEPFIKNIESGKKYEVQIIMG
ncbi:MAG TPA: hypothetical protein PK209_13410, partial [Saprospiraceae bacterium]|nr:hypothetical protein [Saprospiraceae bacterium]